MIGHQSVVSDDVRARYDAFLERACEDVRDNTTQLVFADWLEDEGRELAARNPIVSALRNGKFLDWAFVHLNNRLPVLVAAGGRLVCMDDLNVNMQQPDVYLFGVQKANEFPRHANMEAVGRFFASPQVANSIHGPGRFYTGDGTLVVSVDTVQRVDPPDATKDGEWVEWSVSARIKAYEDTILGGS